MKLTRRKVTRRNFSHGNFHFYPNDKIKLAKSGSFILYFKGLSTVYARIRQKHLGDSSKSTLARLIDATSEWKEFNRSLQLVIDNKLQELDQ